MKPSVLEKLNTLFLILGIVFLSYQYFVFNSKTPTIIINNYVKRDSLQYNVIDSTNHDVKVNLYIRNMKINPKNIEVSK